MSNVAIQVENLGKQYRIGGQQARYKRFTETLMDTLTAPVQRLRRLGRPAPPEEMIWALKDISFEVRQGEVVGIIGRNGAGKSTLLKVLSRITEPTEGEARVYGRVGSLLEVGTGFHPELTGRENIYLNGTILGMKRAEIERKFDEIVAFAEIEKFLDTPVKRYSSGMYVRLAFAVAAHLEPEVLVVDEVLAVGDVQFQKKCMGKMGEVAKGGRTVLFVSHNMTAVQGLCQRAILLNQGNVLLDGESKPVIDRYLQTVDQIAAIPLADRRDRQGNQVIKFNAFELRDDAGSPITVAYSGQNVVVALEYQSDRAKMLKGVHVAIGLHGKFDENLFLLATDLSGSNFKELPDKGVILCNIPRIPLQPGKYSFNLFCTVTGVIADWIQNAGIIEVEAGDFFGSGKLPSVEQGPFIVQHSWRLASTSRLSR